MDEIICYTTLLPEGIQRNITFLELLLNENWANGKIECPESCFARIGNFNQKLAAKKNYEFLLRAAQQYTLKAIGRADTPSEEDGLSLDFSWESYRADCYIAGKYQEELCAAGFLETAIEGLMAEALKFSQPEKAVMWLRKMLSKTDEYYEIDDDTRPILLYRGCSIRFLDQFVDELEAALRSCRQRVEVVNVQDGTMPSQHIGCRFKAVLGMSTNIFSIMYPNKETNLHDLIIGPKYNMIYDHPICLKETCEKSPECYYLLALDRNYCTFAKRYYSKIKDCIYFPPGGKLPDGKYSWDKKQYEVTFVGSTHNYRKILTTLYGLERPYRLLAGRFVGRMVRHPNETAESSLYHVLAERGIELNDTDFLSLFAKLGKAFLCVKEYYREKIIRTLLTAGVEIHVFGDSWQQSSFMEHPCFRWHPNVTVEESLHIMQQSKISMNVMSWHKDGFTERVINIMLSQAVLLSDRSTVLEEDYTDGEDLVLFDLAHLEELPCKIKQLLADEERLQKIAVNGYQKTVQKHLWINRAKEFLSLIG